MLLLVTSPLPPNPSPLRSGTFHAVVRAGDSVTPYVRMGAGHPVLVVRQSGRNSGTWSSVLTTLARGFRVMMPEVSPPLATLADWFPKFHDGVGVGPLHIVTDERYAISILRLALLYGDRIDRIVVITEPDSAPEADGNVGTAGAPGDAKPLLILSNDRPIGELLARTEAYLKTP